MQQRGELEPAAKEFLAALKLTPKDHRLPEEAGNIYLFGLERPVDAIPCYEKAAKLVEDPTALWLRLGLAHSLAGHDKKALDTLSKAGRADPTNPLCHIEFGKHHLTQGRHQDALEYFDTAIAHFTMQRSFGGALGGPPMDPHLLALALMGKARAALIHLGKHKPGMAAVHALYDELDDYQRGIKLATELAEAGKPKVAVDVLDALLERSPKHRSATRLRSQLAKLAPAPAKTASAKPKSPAKKAPAPRTGAKKNRNKAVKRTR